MAVVNKGLEKSTVQCTEKIKLPVTTLLQAHLAQICLRWKCEYKYKPEKILRLPIHIAFALSALLLSLCSPLYPYLCGCKVHIFFSPCEFWWSVNDQGCLAWPSTVCSHCALKTQQPVLFVQAMPRWMELAEIIFPNDFFFFPTEQITTNPWPQSFKRKKTLQSPVYISIRVHGNPSISTSYKQRNIKMIWHLY